MHSQKDPNLQRAMELAATPTGQKLVGLLQEKGGVSLRIAMEKAAAGELQSAQSALSDLLAQPEIQALLRQLEGYECPK